MKRVIALSVVVLLVATAVSCKKNYCNIVHDADLFGTGAANTPVPEIIDLGITVNGKSIKWASFNLGASRPEEAGDYFAWGDTRTLYVSLNPLVWKKASPGGSELSYNGENYIHAHGSMDKLVKYCLKSHSSLWDGSESGPDGLTTLEPEDDAAHVLLGGNWRMPTQEEMFALFSLRGNANKDGSDYLWQDWTSRTNPKGEEIYGLQIIRKSTCDTLFFPASGLIWGHNLEYKNSFGCVWYSTLRSIVSSYADYLRFDQEFCDANSGNDRSIGAPIRPVYVE